jgi:iron complex transport system ATP-binding protein
MAEAADAAISLSGVGFAYRPGQFVFRNYSLAVSSGRVFALLGPNGAGKTTLLKIMLGLLEPQQGTVTIQSRPAFVPQLFQVTFDYTALDMVLMGRVRKIGLFAQPGRADEEAALAALERFGLAALAHRPFHELSGGQRQLTIFARALVAEARILILDEPASSLDLRNQSLVLEWISRLAHTDGLTIVMATHHPNHALAVADDALLMLNDTEYVTGATGDVLTETHLERLYGVPMKRLTLEHAGGVIETLAPLWGRRQ